MQLHFFNWRSFSLGINHRRQALQWEEITADPNLRTKLKIRIHRIVMLWLPSALSDFRVISSIISGIASIWRRISCADTVKTTWKPQVHDDIMGVHCLYTSRVYNFYFDLCLYLVYAIVLCRKLLLRWYSINYIYIWVLVRVIKQNAFTNWLARKVPWSRYFWKHVFHIKIYQPRKYLGVPEVVIYVYLLDCYWYMYAMVRLVEMEEFQVVFKQQNHTTTYR